MPTRSIVLATRNPGKVREIRHVLGGLGVGVASLEDFAPLSEPEERGDTFAANARDKATYYAGALSTWCLADDSGLAVDALDGAPGVRSARYAAEDFPPGADRRQIDRANNAKLLRAMEATLDERRTARFICHLALAGDGRVLLEASGQVEGVILRQGRGDNGFGYDPLFFVPAQRLTMAELPAEVKNAISHRGSALRKMAAGLAELLR